jgi:hypothetical protein
VSHRLRQPREIQDLDSDNKFPNPVLAVEMSNKIYS